LIGRGAKVTPLSCPGAAGSGKTSLCAPVSGLAAHLARAMLRCGPKSADAQQFWLFALLDQAGYASARRTARILAGRPTSTGGPWSPVLSDLAWVGERIFRSIDDLHEAAVSATRSAHSTDL